MGHFSLRRSRHYRHKYFSNGTKTENNNQTKMFPEHVSLSSTHCPKPSQSAIPVYALFSAVQRAHDVSEAPAVPREP